MIKGCKRRKGMVLVSALSALVVILVFLGSFMTLNALRAGIIRQQGDSMRAYYCARAGIELIAYLVESSESGDNGAVPKFPRSVSSARRGADAGETFYVYFHERGEGVFRGGILENSRTEVRWKRIDYESYPLAYAVESKGVLIHKGAEAAERTVYAVLAEIDGRFHIKRWYE